MPTTPIPPLPAAYLLRAQTLTGEVRTLQIENGRIAPLTQPHLPLLDASSLQLAPGFMDLQLNGGFGCDFTQAPETIWQVAAQLPRHGVTSFLPTIITSPLESVAQAQSILTQGAPAGFVGAVPLGLHLEGPFLNPAKKGAHNPAYLQPPALEAVADWSPANGVRLVTLAPELPGVLAVSQRLQEQGVVVSAGHSLATYAEGVTAVANGIHMGTHLFNAMPPLQHREPGLTAALLLDARVVLGLLPDGIHVHPAVIDLVWRVAGPTRIALVTDAMAALAMPPGRYVLGDYDVEVTAVDAHGTTMAQLADGTLAGSTLALDQAVRNWLAFTGCTAVDAITTVTQTPAMALGEHQRGRLEVGCVADMVLLTSELAVAGTLVAGQWAYQREGLTAVHPLRFIG